MSVQTQSYRTLFSGYNVASTGFVYNESGGANATTGWIDVRNDDVLVQTCVATKTRSGSFVYRIEGKFSSYDRSASVNTVIQTEANTIDKLYEVSEKIRELRIGIKNSVVPASISASPVIFYSGVCLVDRN